MLGAYIPFCLLLSLSFLINDLSLLDRADLGDGNRVVIELIAIIAVYGVSAHACTSYATLRYVARKEREGNIDERRIAHCRFYSRDERADTRLEKIASSD